MAKHPLEALTELAAKAERGEPTVWQRIDEHGEPVGAPEVHFPRPTPRRLN